MSATRFFWGAQYKQIRKSFYMMEAPGTITTFWEYGRAMQELLDISIMRPCQAARFSGILEMGSELLEH
jgi:hypothetical protein